MAVTPLKTKFGKLIKDYLRNADIRQKDLAVRLGVSAAAVSQIMHGKIVPNQKQLDVICEMISLDRAQAFELNSMLSRIRTGSSASPMPRCSRVPASAGWSAVLLMRLMPLSTKWRKVLRRPIGQN